MILSTVCIYSETISNSFSLELFAFQTNFNSNDAVFNIFLISSLLHEPISFLVIFLFTY